MLKIDRIVNYSMIDMFVLYIILFINFSVNKYIIKKRNAPAQASQFSQEDKEKQD